jgi:hypothetical protein
VMLPPHNQPGSAGKPSAPQEKPEDQQIDLQALADKVYKLLQRELAVERERLGWKRRW